MDFYPVLIDRVSIRFTNRRRVDLHMSGAQSESRFISAWSRNPCADARTERVADELHEKGIKGEKWIRQASGYRRESIWFRPFTEIIATTKKENIFFGRLSQVISDISRVSEGNSIQHRNAHMISNLIEFPSIILTWLNGRVSPASFQYFHRKWLAIRAA